MTIPYFSIKQISEQVTFRRDDLLRVSFQPISVDKPEEEEIDLNKIKSELISNAEANYIEYMEDSFALDEDEERLYEQGKIEDIALDWYNEFAKGLDDLYQETFGQTEIDPDEQKWIQEQFQSHIEGMMGYKYFVEKSDELWMTDYQDSDGNTYWKRTTT